MTQLDLSLEQLADLADAIGETTPRKSATPHTHATSVKLNKLMTKMEDLSKKADALTSDRARTFRSDFRSRAQSRSPSLFRNTMC